MKDETRDALLIAVAEALVGGYWENTGDGYYQLLDTTNKLNRLLKKAKHEQERPTDRGA